MADITKATLGEQSWWNHRVFRDAPDKWSIRECHYDAAYAKDVPQFWDAEPLIYAESTDDLRQTLLWMLACLDRPALYEVEHGDGTAHVEILKDV